LGGRKSEEERGGKELRRGRDEKRNGGKRKGGKGKSRAGYEYGRRGDGQPPMKNSGYGLAWRDTVLGDNEQN